MNHPKSLQFILILALVASLSSCYSVYYVPSAQNVPLHDEKGGARVRGSAGTGITAKSLDFQGSFAFTKELAIMANYQYAFWDGVTYDDVNGGMQRYTEMGIGYYKKFDHDVIFETYVGGGGGTITNEHPSGESTLGFNKVFIQPQVGFVTEKLEFAVGTRIYWLNYRDFAPVGSIPGEEMRKIDQLFDNSTYLLAEPHVTFRFGHDPVKVQLQLVPVGNIRRRPLNPESLMIYGGIQFKF